MASTDDAEDNQRFLIERIPAPMLGNLERDSTMKRFVFLVMFVDFCAFDLTDRGKRIWGDELAEKIIPSYHFCYHWRIPITPFFSSTQFFQIGQ